MFNTGNCPSVPIVANLDGNNGNNWNDGSWLWFLIVVFAIFGGWGNGFGGFGGTNGGVGSEIQRGFDNSAVISKLDGISNGLCDGFYAMNNSMLTGFNGINTNIMQTGYGIQQAVNADTVANMQNTNALQSQLNLKGATNTCKAKYRVEFNGNIAVPTGGTAGAISLAIAVEGEPDLSTLAISTPTAVEAFNNVSMATDVWLPCGCCQAVSVKNTSAQAISVANASITVNRIG